MPSRSSWSYLPYKGGASTDERYTPQWILDLAVQVMGGIDLDPCADPQKRVPAATHYTKAADGLNQAWAGRVFLNPPYSAASQWLKHLCLYVEAGAVPEAMVLVPVTSVATKSARLLMRDYASCLVIIDRTTNFLGADYRRLPTSSPIPLCLVYLGPNSRCFLELAGQSGSACILHKAGAKRRRYECQYCGVGFVAKRSTAKFCSTTCRVLSHRKHGS